jgi:hypothetical protein
MAKTAASAGAACRFHCRQSGKDSFVLFKKKHYFRGCEPKGRHGQRSVDIHLLGNAVSRGPEGASKDLGMEASTMGLICIHECAMWSAAVMSILSGSDYATLFMQ